MRLLHVVPTYVPAWRHGGPVRAVHGLCRALAAQGHRVDVFTTNVHANGSLEVPVLSPTDIDGVRVTYFPVSWRRLYRSPAMGRALRERVGHYDVVHLHSVFTWPTSAAARAAQRAGIPYVVAPRGMLVPELLRRRGRLRKALWLAAMERRTLRASSFLHATSSVERRDLGRLGWDLPPIQVVPNGVDDDDSRSGEPSPTVEAATAAAPFALFLGRLSWKKGLDRFIAAMRLAPDIQLVVAGNDDEGYRPRLEALARAAGVAERLTLVGEVHGPDKAALLERATFLVLPSISENFGNVVLESLLAGRPVLVTPQVGAADLVEEIGCGLVSEGEPAALAAAARRLLGDPALCDEMGRLGRDAVAGRFGWPAIAARMTSLYRGIPSGRFPATDAAVEAPQ